ncbi:GT99 family glycosyltransferase N-terminal domain-containing protein [Agrobacterium fabrum]|uniref:GT99 family glycosyltransferase N-terminal domain-containing protein n=1 Tax=Agrobacterium fabrum TaxID=1176649 RepID=UPI00298EE4C2|nr:hypothetical protein [Agrobacterium fabrum]
MHFVLVVPPLSATGDDTYYFWVFQKWLHETRDHNSTIIMPATYVPALKDDSRWEFSEQSVNFNQFEPSSSIGENTEVIFYPSSIYSSLPTECPPSTKFVDLITRDQPTLTQFYVEALRAIKVKSGGDVAIVTWLNNASLRSASNAADCRLIFNEFGPFRKPHYLPTAYWDRHGVNGETEVTERWQQERDDFGAWRNKTYPKGGSTHDLRTLLADPSSHLIVNASKPHAKIGLALQVETDSNALAYGNGWNNLALINHAKRSGEADNILLRLHPGGAAIYPGEIDLSPSPLEFLASVGEVWTVNSSLGIEALFWGRNALIFGESPIKPITMMNITERETFLEWFTLCYLIPFDLLFDLDYYSWRLTNPSASEISIRHVAAYRAGPKHQWNRIPFPAAADRGKPSIDFPGPHRAPRELSELRTEILEMRRYITKLEKDFQDAQSVVGERDALAAEKDDAITKYQLATKELDAIISSIPFQLLKRLHVFK